MNQVVIFVLEIVAGIAVVWLCASEIIRAKKFPKEIRKHFENVSKAIFPGGKSQIKHEAELVAGLSHNKLRDDEAENLMLKGSYMFAMSKKEDRKEEDMIKYIVRQAGDKINREEALEILKHIVVRVYNITKQNEKQ